MEASIGDRLSGQALALAVEHDALALGFARIGFVPVTRSEEAAAHLERFRQQGFAGEMQYLATGDRDDPTQLLPGAKSVVVAAIAYGRPDLLPLRRADTGPLGQVAGYARGQDYHPVMKAKLARLAERIATLAGRSILARACVDTAPLLERDLARRAGLGFVGKSAMLITPGLGSTLLLGELLLDLELEPLVRVNQQTEGCGECRACLDACPTGAFVGPYRLDARRCISYLTIEYQGTIPEELRRPIGRRVFGCDVCQGVCPFNASTRPRPASLDLVPLTRLTTLDLVELLFIGSAAYRRLVRKTALRRASRATLQRNAAVALGNTNDPRAVPPLVLAVSTHPVGIVRAHAAWALGELCAYLDQPAREALREASQRLNAPEAAEARSALSRS